MARRAGAVFPSLLPSPPTRPGPFPFPFIVTSPVAAILPDASMVDFPGRLAAVFFVQGCNFRCGYCHNPGLRRSPAADLAGCIPWSGIDAACRRFRDNWTDAAVITGGEPTGSPLLVPLVERLRAHGFAVKLDTNGSRPDVLESLLPLLDYVAMDIKFPPSDYPRRTGFADTAALERSIALLKARGPAAEFRTTVVAAWHDEAAIRSMGEWVHAAGDGTPAAQWYLQAFRPHGDLPDPACRSFPETPPALLRSLAPLLRPHALRTAIRGEF